MRTFTYRFLDGTEIEHHSMTVEILEELAARHGECVYNGFRDHLSSLHLLRVNVQSRGDGWKPGFHPGVGKHFSSYEKYQSYLKENNLNEIGNERPKAAPKKQEALFSDADIKDIRAKGAEISDREADKLTGKIE
jgi:hypothetical protein